ncbi:hypothetical protein Hanom_Chr03g00229731 [Helianthus anomalus]
MGGLGNNLCRGGGLSLMLKFIEEEDASKFVLDSSLWKPWFSSLDVWEGQVTPFDRIAWFRIYGVPLHLAKNEVFDEVVANFGKIVHSANIDLTHGDLSVACVGIIVGEGRRINVPVKFKWQDRSFMLWVKEEEGVWEPICVGKVVSLGGPVDSSSEGESSPMEVEKSPAVDEEVREGGREESSPSIFSDTRMGKSKKINGGYGPGEG